MAWTRACAVADLKPGEAIRIDVNPPVAVFNVHGEFLATSDTCTHADSSLADGYVEDDEVECAWHFAKFCLRTGQALCQPAIEDLRTYPTKIEDNDVLVDV
jgi:3-phenylpropionate/trans-cinnamate dioxygenase ferredoxin component